MIGDRDRKKTELIKRSKADPIFCVDRMEFGLIFLGPQITTIHLHFCALWLCVIVLLFSASDCWLPAWHYIQCGVSLGKRRAPGQVRYINIVYRYYAI